MKKESFLSVWSCVGSPVSRHHLDSNETKTKKATYTDVACCFEEMLVTLIHKRATVRPLTSHPSKTKKTSGVIREKQGRTYKRHSCMDTLTCSVRTLGAM